MPTVNLRCDNINSGVLEQYLINMGFNMKEGDHNFCNPYSAMSWDSTPNSCEIETTDVSLRAYLLGGRDDMDNENISSSDAVERNYLHLLRIKMPKEPFKNAKIENVYLKTRGRIAQVYQDVESGFTYWLFKANKSHSWNITTQDYISAVDKAINCIYLTFNSSGGYISNSGWSSYDLSETSSFRRYFNGTEYSSDIAIYPFVKTWDALDSQRNVTYCFFCTDNPYSAFAFGIHPRTYERHRSPTDVNFYCLKKSGSTWNWSSIDIIFDETDSPSKPSLYYSGRIFFMNVEPTRATTSEVASAIANFIGHGISAPSGLPNNKYWYCIKSQTYLDENISGQKTHLQHIRPIVEGQPSAYMPRVIPAYTYYWKTNPDPASSSDNDAFSPKEKYNSSGSGEYAFGAVDCASLDYTDNDGYNWFRLTFNLNSLELDWGEEATLFIRAQNKEKNHLLYRTFGPPNVYSDYCFLEIECSYEEGDSGVSNLKIEPYSKDPRYMVVKWDEIKGLDSLASITIQAREASSSTWKDIGTITDIGKKEYLLIDGSTNIGNNKTCLSDNLNIQVRLKLNLSVEGYATNYNPVLYSPVVSAYRPGPTTSGNGFELAEYIRNANIPLSFNISSANAITGFYIRKRIIDWGDGTCSYTEFNPPVSSDTSYNIQHIYKTKDIDITTAKVYWETENGFRSMGTACVGKFIPSSFMKTTGFPPLLRATINKSKASSGDDVYIDFTGSMPSTTDDSITSCLYLFGSNTTADMSVSTSLLNKLTMPSNNGYFIPAVLSEAYTGDFFDGGVICSVNNGSLSYYYAYSDNRVNISAGLEKCTISVSKPIYLFTTKKLKGLIVYTFGVPSPSSSMIYYSWNGSTFAEIQNYTQDSNLWGSGCLNKYKAVIFGDTELSSMALMDADTRQYEGLTLYDVYTPFYCIKIAPELSGSYTYDLRLIPIYEDSFQTVEITSNSIISLNDLTDFYIQDVELSLPRELKKYILADNERVYITDNGFSGYEISFNAVIKGQQSVSSGNLINGTNLTTKDYLVYIMREGIPVQVDYERDLDIYRGRISKLSFKRNAGAYHDLGVSISMLVDSVLFYTEGNINVNNTLPYSYENISAVVEQGSSETYFLFPIGATHISVGDYFIAFSQDQNTHENAVGLYKIKRRVEEDNYLYAYCDVMPNCEPDTYTFDYIYFCKYTITTPTEAQSTTIDGSAGLNDFRIFPTTTSEASVYTPLSFNTGTLIFRQTNLDSITRKQATINQVKPSAVRLGYYVKRYV